MNPSVRGPVEHNACGIIAAMASPPGVLLRSCTGYGAAA